MAFTYWLPDEQGAKKEYETSSNAVIIIGANGAGKSKLGAWIEEKNSGGVHRVGAQRNLNFNPHIALRSFSQAEDLVFYGSDTEGLKSNKYRRWNKGEYTTTKLLDDFDDVLSALVARDNNDRFRYFEECKQAQTEGEEKPSVPTTIIEILQGIFSIALPQRKLEFEDSQFYAVLNKDGDTTKYSATEMSDGERAVLYLAAQVLCVPQNKILIIDEPEVHLHRSIMNRLWKTLEQNRPDCLFLYITHDTQFAAAHGHADIIWVKEFDGQNWKLKKLESHDLPEELLLEILGSRKNVLFVEGERDSYDIKNHRLRAEYASKLLHQLENERTEGKPLFGGEFPLSDYCCLKGKDKKRGPKTKEHDTDLVAAVSGALGHNRVEVVLRHYMYLY